MSHSRTFHSYGDRKSVLPVNGWKKVSLHCLLCNWNLLVGRGVYHAILAVTRDLGFFGFI
jgi:hypothetical protein